MRWWLALLLIIPFAQGAQWDDPAEDQQYGRTLAITDQGPQEQWLDVGPYGWYPQADVLSASITETPTHLLFTVTLQATDADPLTTTAPGSQAPGSWLYEWEFDYKGDRLMAGFERYGDDPDDVWFFLMERTVGPGFISISYRAVWHASAMDDAPGYRAMVPKFLIRDADQIPIREGDRFEGMRFVAKDGDYFHPDLVPCPNTDPQQPFQALIGSDCGWRVRDRMQDGADLGDFEVKMTPPGVGHLFMRVEDPVRQSNGLATTFLFEATVHNLEDVADDVLVQVSGIPAKWEVHAPAVVSFNGKGEQVVPIAVTVPFEHQHGVQHFMELTVASERDSTAALSSLFGIIYADPAQPGGHHDTLYFHRTPDNPYWGWMNTDIDDGTSTEPIYAWNTDFVPNERFEWEIWMSPNLDMGLDFDLGREGELVFDLETPLAFEGTVDGTLVLWNWDTGARTPLATGSTQVAIEAATPTEVRLPMAPERFADLIPPAPRTNLVMIINATSELPGAPVIGRMQNTAKLHTQDAFLQLPLIDFHDTVDLTGLQVAAFDLEALNGTHRAVNPGKTAAVAFNVSSLLDVKTTLEWELKGTPPFLDWAALPTPVTHLQPGGNGTVVVRYQPPATATEEDIAEFVLIGKSREDENQQVFARIAFFVEVDKDIPDEAAWAEALEGTAAKTNALADKESPGLPVLALLGALLLAARRR